MLTAGKILVALVWLASLWALFLPATHPWSTTGRLLLLVMGVVHGAEALAFLPRLRAAGGSLAGHLVQTLLFGFLHIGGLGREAR